MKEFFFGPTDIHALSARKLVKRLDALSKQRAKLDAEISEALGHIQDNEQHLSIVLRDQVTGITPWQF